jgi:ribulose-phosphate 3-epimerase
MKTDTTNKEKNLDEVEIIPAVMPSSYDHLRQLVRLGMKVSDWIQLDVMDRKYTESITWPYTHKGNHFEKILREEEGLPFWEEVNYSVDLMTLSPGEEAIRWAEAGAARIILHNKSFKDISALKETVMELRDRNVEVEIALLPSEDVDQISSLVSLIDAVQYMGIARVGFQGEPFDASVIGAIQKAKKLFPDVLIAVDGSVHTGTIGELYDAGARRFAVGSFLFDGGGTIDEKEKMLRGCL